MMKNPNSPAEAVALLDSMIGQDPVQGRCTTCRKSLRYSCECDGEPGEPFGVTGREADRMADLYYA